MGGAVGGLLSSSVRGREHCAGLVIELVKGKG